jgi:plasmid stability protein
MANLTIKGMAPQLIDRLKSEAQRHRRSLNQEVIARLEASAQSVPVDPAAFLARAREIRKLLKGPALTEKRLKELKTAGRL